MIQESIPLWPILAKDERSDEMLSTYRNQSRDTTAQCEISEEINKHHVLLVVYACCQSD